MLIAHPQMTLRRWTYSYACSIEPLLQIRRNSHTRTHSDVTHTNKSGVSNSYANLFVGGELGPKSAKERIFFFDRAAWTFILLILLFRIILLRTFLFRMIQKNLKIVVWKHKNVIKSFFSIFLRKFWTKNVFVNFSFK